MGILLGFQGCKLYFIDLNTDENPHNDVICVDSDRYII